MPLGEIKPRELTPEETRWRSHWAQFEGREVFSLEAELKVMSKKEYFAFMYFIDPRLALVMSQDPNMKLVLEYQRDKSFLQEFRDYLWRKFDDWKNAR